jgi:hypothetical protein
MAVLICPTHGVSRPNPTGFCKLCGARLIVSDAPAGVTGGRRLPQLPVLGTLAQKRAAFIGAAVAVVLLIALVVWWWPSQSGFNGMVPTLTLPTPAATVQGVSGGLETPIGPVQTTTAETASAMPTTTQTSIATQAQPTTIREPPIARQIDPTRVFGGKLPITLMVTGTNLDQVDEVTLIRSDGATATIEVQPSADNQARLIIRALPEPPTRELTFTLWLDGRPQEVAPLVVRNYIESKTMAGVKAEYAYTNRVNPDGPYTRMRAETNVESEPVGMLYNGDGVDVLQDDVEGWYQLRIQASRDPAQQSIIGWIERWLVDDIGVPPPPPTPTPLPVVRFTARIDVNFVGSGNSGQFTSCVAGRVYRPNGGLYQGAQVNVNNGPVNSFNARTGRDGVYRVCGLGASNWSVVLRSAPGVQLAQQTVKVVYVNGSAQEAIVHFFQQR